MSNSERISASHCEGSDIHQLRAARIGDVGDVAATGGQVPDEPAVDGPEQDVAGGGFLAGARNVIEKPAQLQAGEVARQRKSGLVAQAVVAAVAREFGDDGIDPRILPDEGVVQGLSRAPVPDQRGLALVGDSDRGEIAAAFSPFCARASPITASVFRQISIGSCST